MIFVESCIYIHKKPLFIDEISIIYYNRVNRIVKKITYFLHEELKMGGQSYD